MGDKKVRMQFGNKFFSSILAMMVVITTIFANDIMISFFFLKSNIFLKIICTFL